MPSTRPTATPSPSPLRKRLALALLAVFVLALGFLGSAGLRHDGPPDPVYKGHRLSWWVQDAARTGKFLPANDVQAMGPPAMQWLSHAIEHGRVPQPRRPPANRAERWWRSMEATWRKWLGISERPYDERISAMFFVFRAGPVVGAPTVPALIRTLADPDEGYSGFAGMTLASFGPTAQPAVLELIGRGDSPARRNLIDALTSYHPPADRPDTTSALVIDYLVLLCRDENPDTRRGAAIAIIQETRRLGANPGVKTAIETLVGLVQGQDQADHISHLDILSQLGRHAAPAIPHFLPLLEDSDPQVFLFAARRFAEIDPSQKQAVPRLRTLLASPDSQHRSEAGRILSLLGEPN